MNKKGRVPRQLTILRIDDGLSNVGSDPTEVRQDVPPPSLKLFTVADLMGVSRWKYALKWWVEYNGTQTPDLVVADVRFEGDTTTPLYQVLKEEIHRPVVSGNENTLDFVETNPNKASRHNNLPTGLSHLKPFAALARGLMAPIGVALHTGDSGLWARLANDYSKLQRCMAYLAAHEIGELAAILGDKEFISSIEGETPLQVYCDWLEANSANRFDVAYRVAIQNYRRRLVNLTRLQRKPSIMLMPDDLMATIEWCTSMRRKPTPINLENDPGLTLTYSDGRKDTISIASLFADVDDIMSEPQNAGCFHVSQIGSSEFSESRREESAVLDDRGAPQIGEFLAALGTLTSVFTAAVRIAGQFEPELIEDPGSTDQQKLIAAVPATKSYYKLTRGLVILFQLLRFEKSRFDEWSNLLHNQQWLMTELRFGDVKANTDSLANALRELVHRVEAHLGNREKGQNNLIDQSSSASEFELLNQFEITAITDELEDDDFQGKKESMWWNSFLQSNSPARPTTWMRWHFDRLVDIGILVQVSQDSYEAVSPYLEFKAPPVPLSTDSLNAFQLVSYSNIITWLNTNLGLDQTNGLGRLLCAAFVDPDAPTDNETAKLGRAFFDDLLHNKKGPAWLLDLCRHYAREQLRWRDESTWPEWVR